MIADNQDKPRCHCAVFGVFGHPSAAQFTYYGLLAQQHRGQEGSGIVTSQFDPKIKRHRFHMHKDFGLVTEIYRDEKLLTETLRGSMAVGHNRYSTAGAADNKLNIQPLTVIYKNGNLAVAHNGNLTNFKQIRKELQEEGTIFQTTSDTEVILHLIARSKEKDQIDQIREALSRIRGAFSLVIMTDDKLIAARDQSGFRPLALGKKLNASPDGSQAFFISSETVGFDIIDAEYERDIEPGELVVIDAESTKTGAVKSLRIHDGKETPHHCIFEYIYFSRPDSRIFGHSVDKVRRKLGKNLAKTKPVRPKDSGAKVIVINVPDSSNTATMGFVQETNKHGGSVKLEIGLIRSHYIGRTFIQPKQDVRENKVKTKFNTVKGVLKDNVVVIVDDSIVRGTTSKQLVQLVKQAGPKEVHFRVTSPPIKFPCHYGMDFPTPDELVANQCNGDVKKIGAELGVNSLEYLEIDDLLDSVPQENGANYCTACFSGKYPIPIDSNQTKDENEA
ncbi:MAG: amidophosphoribosyltransferase [Bacteroidetes bacterium]|nr:amidophosphoribosyltransferase [Bacteroidota bacterium]MCW5897007.1 amidophosphoribosyltransferase [Bacteroidota bacterium]